MNWIIKKTFCWISCHSLMGWISFPVNKLFFSYIFYCLLRYFSCDYKKILTNVRVILVNMVELVLTLLVDFVVNAHQNGLVTYAKLVSSRKKMFLQSTRKKKRRKNTKFNCIRHLSNFRFGKWDWQHNMYTKKMIFNLFLPFQFYVLGVKHRNISASFFFFLFLFLGTLPFATWFNVIYFFLMNK